MMEYTNNPPADYERYQARKDRERWPNEAQERLQQTSYWWSLIWDRGNPDDNDLSNMTTASNLAHFIQRCVSREQTLVRMLGEDGEREFKVALTQEIITRLDERNRER